jgi:hypothetical protein
VLRRRVTVEESLAEISGQLIFGTTKSHARRRVPVPASLLARLPAAGPDEFLFRGPKGGPLRYRHFYMRHWRPALQELNLPAVGVHVLRHSAAARIVSGRRVGQDVADGSRPPERSVLADHLRAPVRRRPRRAGRPTGRKESTVTMETCNLLRRRALAIEDDSTWDEVFEAVLDPDPELVSRAAAELMAATRRARELGPALASDSAELTAFNAVQAALREIEQGQITREEYKRRAVSLWIMGPLTYEELTYEEPETL